MVKRRSQVLSGTIATRGILENIWSGSGNRTRTLSLEGSYDTISPYPLVRMSD